MRDFSGHQLGNYQVIRLLGRGGFADVYLGEHLYLKTQVAIKILQANVTRKDDLESFLKEARTVAHLVHPHIVRVVDFGVSEQTPFLVMDYASHGTLRTRLPKSVPIPLATILPYVKQIAAALQYAHDEKVIHRDVKPENMLIGKNHEVLLGDFGIALAAQSSRSQRTQDVIGTAAYMAPEQIQGKPRVASDQYVLGIVIYEWLSGDQPFHGSFTEQCAQHLFAPPPALRQKLPTIAPGVEQVILRALAKDPKQRFGSIGAFASAFEQACHPAASVVVAPKPAQTPLVSAQGAMPLPSRVPPLPNIASSWSLPDISLLHLPQKPVNHELDQAAATARLLQETLHGFRVYAEVREEDIGIGPTVIRFGIRPTGKPKMKRDEKAGNMVPVRDAVGSIVYEMRTRVSRIMALEHDLALALEAKSIRMETPAPERPYVSLEIPKKDRQIVTLREILESKEYQAARVKSRIALALGRDVGGRIRVSDLATAHLLIAGEPESGKSSLIKTLIASVLTQATPDNVRLLIIDLQRDNLSRYNGIPHLLVPVVTEGENVVPLLKNALNEMERRYRLFSQLGVRNLDGYRRMRLEKIGKGDTSLNNLPSIVMIIDELADIMRIASQEAKDMIDRLARLARATGMYLVIVTGHPSREMVTGLMTVTPLTRLSLKVSSSGDSRTILGMDGAECLLGRGDLLYLPAEAGRPERVQAACLSDDEATALADYWRQQAAARAHPRSNAPNDALLPSTRPGWEIKEVSSNDGDLDDDLLKAEAIVREYGRVSISLLQRRLRIGYSRAVRLIDLLEGHGVIGPSERRAQGREVLEKKEATKSEVALDDDLEERARNEFLRNEFLKRTKEQ